MGRGQTLYKQAKKIIPGGTQLLSKRSEMHLPESWPAYYQKAKGCMVWDLDNKKYIDMSYMGVGTSILGYADHDVDNAVKKAINSGSASTLNCYEEVELAKRLCALHPWAKMARFARTGGESVSIAVRIARAHTGRDIVIFCGYHGWHDWYLSANLATKKTLDGHLLPGLAPLGVPRGLKGTAFPFEYNDIDGFQKLIQKHKNKIATVIMEPIRNFSPEKGFLEKIRKITKAMGIILIFDEISSGWRHVCGGAHLMYKVYPDMAVFGKAMSNGYPMGAVIGRKGVMEAAQKTFISSTSWTERIGPAAALSTIHKLRDKKVCLHLSKIGKKVQDGWRHLADKHQLNIFITGTYPLSYFSFAGKHKKVFKTIFTQEMLKKGFLATTAFYASFAHKDYLVRQYLENVEKVFAFISDIQNEKDPSSFLEGPVCHDGFRRLT